MKTEMIYCGLDKDYSDWLKSLFSNIIWRTIPDISAISTLSINNRSILIIDCIAQNSPLEVWKEHLHNLSQTFPIKILYIIEPQIFQSADKLDALYETGCDDILFKSDRVSYMRTKLTIWRERLLHR